MSLTVSSVTQKGTWGNKRAVEVDIAFDSSYPNGGEAVTVNDLSMPEGVSGADIFPINGYLFQWDNTNKKIKVFYKAPVIRVEEAHTIASNAITLDYPPAFVMNVCQAGANVKITDAGATLAANECQPTAAFTANTLGGLTFHSGLSGVVYVTYITQAWAEVWANVVQGEAVTITSNTGNLANNAVAFQSVRSTGSTTSTNCCLMLDKDDTVATTEVDIDFTPGTGNTLLTFAAADGVSAATVTYIKKPSSGFLKDRFVEEEDMTASSEICTPAKPILIWGYSGQAPENGADTETLIEINGTQGTDEAFINFFTGYTVDYHACTTGTGTYVAGRPWEVPSVPLEVAAGADLSELTGVKARFYSR